MLPIYVPPVDIQSIIDQSAFTPWQAFSTFSGMPEVDQQGGLYRVRIAGEMEWMYVGVTDCPLRDPLQNIKRALNDSTLPGHEPHTAGAHLWWRMRHQRVQYEISVAPFPLLSSTMRQRLKSLALALHRQQHRLSPQANYSRLPQDLVDESRRLSPQRFQPGAPPLGPLTSFGAYSSRFWGHYIWSPWVPLAQVQPAALSALALTRTNRGFFRLRRHSDGEPLFVGYGSIYTNLLAWQFCHREVFLRDLDCSWVCTSLPTHIGRERFDDLLAGFLLARHPFPIAGAACRTLPDEREAVEHVTASILVA